MNDIKDQENTHLCIGCSVAVNDCECIWSNFLELYQMFSNLEDKISTELEILNGFNQETQKDFNRLFERISDLEAKNREQLNKMGELSLKINSTNSSLREFEKQRINPKFEEIHAHIDKLHTMINMEDRITASDFLLRLTAIEETIHRITEEDMKAGRKPHKCPVCEGFGRVISPIAKCDFDGVLRAGIETHITCPSCEGKGIVWG